MINEKLRDEIARSYYIVGGSEYSTVVKNAINEYASRSAEQNAAPVDSSGEPVTQAMWNSTVRQCIAAIEHAAPPIPTAPLDGEPSQQGSRHVGEGGAAPTPRTDALDKRCINEPDEIDETDYRALCRQLEQELAAAKASAARWMQLASENVIVYNKYARRAEKAEAALTELQKRLDDADAELPPKPIFDYNNTATEYKIEAWEQFYDALRTAATEKIAALKAENEKLRKDAERYRYLRENYTTQQPSVTIWWELPANMAAWDSGCVDKCVDAARFRSEPSNEDSGAVIDAAKGSQP